MSLLVALLCWTSQVHADTRIVRIPIAKDENQAFFHELLVTAFAAVGQQITLEGVSGPGNKRYKMMLRTGELDIMWMLRGAQHDRFYIPVDFPLTGGLIGKRILMIRTGEQSRFDGITNVDDFQRLGLRAGMGRDWGDVDIWHMNGLPVGETVWEWRLLFRMLAVGNRRMDYVPRGAIEIQGNMRKQLGLEVERHLLLQYQRDSIFYLSPLAGRLAPSLRDGLELLRANGTYDRLVEKHYGALSRELGLNERRVLKLQDINDGIN